jgi:hypothetical protein
VKLRETGKEQRDKETENLEDREKNERQDRATEIQRNRKIEDREKN